MSLLACKYHPLASLVEDSHAGDMVCAECGLVVGDRLVDVGTEWRTFSNDSSSRDASRVGDAEDALLAGGDLSTRIQGGADGNPYRNRSNLDSQTRALTSAFRAISLMADRLHLPDMIVDKTKTLYKRVWDSRAVRGRALDAVVAACLYIACRQEGVPRSFKEMCAVSTAKRKETARTFKLIIRALEASVDMVSSGDFMSRFCALLGLEREVQRAATRVAKESVRLGLVSGRSPISVAAAAIYMAAQLADDTAPLAQLPSVTGVAESTVKAVYKLIYPQALDLLPDDYKFLANIHKMAPP